MPCLRTSLATALLLLCGISAAQAAAREPVPLNDFTRLGQRFTAARPFNGIWVVVPSWSDNEGGLTLTLWDSPQRSRRLAQQAFTGVIDNARVELRVPKPLPAGAYYWEIHERTGQTRIGLWSDILDAATEECAYLDGKPDRKRRFSSGTVGAALVYDDVPKLVAVLRSGAPITERAEACRQLAVVGNRASVQALADLLGDDQLSHMARFALQPLPDPAVDAAFRGALGKLKGGLLVGVINSIGVRRDARAVDPLGGLLRNADPEVAAAAAVALGEIGTPAAAEALEKAVATAPAALRPALDEGSLGCARTLAGRGERDRARAIYDRLRRQPTSPAIRVAALRGAIVTRGAGDLTLLLERLRGADAAMADVALWVVQRELPGESVTRDVAAELIRVPADRQPLLVLALGRRGDPAALPALLAAATAGDKAVRLAALRALPAVGDASAVPVLVNGTVQEDAEIARAAQDALALLPRGEATAAAMSLLAHADARARLAGIALVQTQRLPKLLLPLHQAGRDQVPEVRVAALRALGEMARADAIPPLLDLLAAAGSEAERGAAEGALAAVCGREGDPDACAGQIMPRLAGTTAAQRTALLRVLATVGGAKALQAVREALNDADPEVRATALQALSEWETPDAAPHLLALARTAATPADRLRCLRACLRIAGAQDLPQGQRLSLCKDAAGLVERDEERKLLLGALGSIAAPEALALVLPLLDNAATQEEASAAAVRIAEKLIGGPYGPGAVAALEKVARTTGNPELAKRAQALLKGSGR